MLFMEELDLTDFLKRFREETITLWWSYLYSESHNLG